MTIHVLLVDDEPALLELTKFFLERGTDLKVETATSARAAIDMMAKSRFDVIVSDFMMPEIDGLEFLKILRNQGNEIPFIIFTGRGREDIAIEALNSGADFYIQKGGDPKSQFAELSNMIRQSVARRMAEEELQESERRFRAMMDNIHHMVVVMNTGGMITYVNDAAARVTGWSKAELLGKDFFSLFSPRSRLELWREEFVKIMGGELALPATPYEHEIVTKDGRTLLISWDFTIIHEHGRTAGVAGIGTNVTHSRKAEEALRRSEEVFRLIAENARDLVFRYRLQPEPGFEYVSPSATSMTGYSPEEHYADPQLMFKLVHPDDRALLEAFIRPPLDASKPVAIRWVHKDGRVIWTEMQVAPVTDASGQVVAINGVSRDISDRKFAEEALQQNLKDVAALLDSLPGYAFLKDADGVYVMANQTFSDAVGCSKDQIPGKTDFDLFPRKLAEKYRSDDARVLSSGKGLYVGEEDMIKGDGKIVVATRKVPVRDASGRVVGVIGLGFDITERTQYEEVIKLRLKYESLLNEISSEGVRAKTVEQLLDRSIELMGDGFGASRAYVFRYDAVHGTFSNTNEWVAKGVRSERSNLQNLPESRFPLWLDKLRKHEVILYERIEDIPSEEDRQRLAPQGIKSILVVPLYSSDDKLFGFIGLDQVDRHRKWSKEDIDLLVAISRMLMALVGEKTAEEMLQESEQRYRSFFENTGSATAVIEEDMTISLVNNEFERISGYTKDEIVGRKWTGLVHRDDLARMREYHKLRRTDPDKAPSSYEFRFVAKDGRLIDVRANMSMIPGTKKSIGSFYDITAAKQAERAVAASERFLSSIFSSIQDGISVLDKEMRIVKVNQTMEKWYAHAMPLVGKKCYEAYHGGSGPCQVCPTMHTLRTEKAAREIVPKVGPHQDVVGWLELHSFPQRDPTSDELIGVIEYVRDVSDKKLYEDALKKANEKLQLMGRVTRHDALNQLSVLTGWLGIALETIQDGPLLGYLKRMREAADTIRAQLEFTADYEAMGVLGPSWIKVEGSLARGITGLALGSVALEKDVAGLELFCDPMLDKVFHNLVDNSLRHGNKVTTIKISYQETPQGLLLTYEDDGEGISNEMKESIFEAGQGKHTGYGLFLSRAVLGITGITISETGIPGKGVRFEIRVPHGKYRLTRPETRGVQRNS